MRVFLTGATGFIGRALLERLDASRCEEVRCLVRDASRLAGKSPRPTYVHAVEGDLLRPETYGAALAGCDAVVHLAAAVGKASEADHFRVNVEGTRLLLDAAAAARVPRFLHVSTIAVVFPEKTHYAYGRAKERAEEIVRAAPLDWAIVRPTIVLGPGSGWGKKLAALASAPVPFVFGDGRTRLQPVDVRDVATFLAGMLGLPELGGETIDLGGPTRLTFDEMLARARDGGAPPSSAHGARLPAAPSAAPSAARRPFLLHVPARPLVGALAALERVFGAALPVTAGQFYGFLHDTTAEPHPLVARLLPSPRPLEAMIAELVDD